LKRAQKISLIGIAGTFPAVTSDTGQYAKRGNLGGNGFAQGSMVNVWMRLPRGQTDDPLCGRQ